MAATIVLIPADEGRPLSEVAVDGPLGRDVVSHLRSLARGAGGTASVDASVLIRPASSAPGGERGGEAKEAGGARSDGDGLLAYSVSTAAGGKREEEESRPNVRATRLAMACGRHGLRLRGDVWAARLGGEAGKGGAPPTLLDNVGCRPGDVGDACLLSPDLREEVLGRLRRENGGSAMATAGLDSECASRANEDDGGSRAARRWLGDAAMRAYRDGGSIAALAKAMSRAEEPGGTSSEDDEGSDDDASSTSSDSSSSEGGEGGDSAAAAAEEAGSSLVGRTLCIHCRGPADALCAGCGGVYLHPECKSAGWSHACLCRTWKVYADRRASLSDFASCFSGWQEPLLTSDNFASEAPYRDFLKGLGVLGADTWWSTELDGWSGGDGDGARRVDPARRRDYADGFGLGPGSAGLIPPERRATKDDLARAGLDADGFGLPGDTGPRPGPTDRRVDAGEAAQGARRGHREGAQLRRRLRRAGAAHAPGGPGGDVLGRSGGHAPGRTARGEGRDDVGDEDRDHGEPRRDPGLRHVRVAVVARSGLRRAGRAAGHDPGHERGPVRVRVVEARRGLPPRSPKRRGVLHRQLRQAWRVEGGAKPRGEPVPTAEGHARLLHEPAAIQQRVHTETFTFPSCQSRGWTEKHVKALRL
ncbi:hypothetical protein THAOC_24326, partial [Thalassiosira oceanica]